MSNDKITEVGINIQEKATVIWNIANALFGYFKPHEYGLVILPMTVVKRFHDCLLPTHAAVREQYEKVKKLAVIDGFLTRASGYQFYNTSKYTFDLLLSDPDNIEANFRDYLAGFSHNVQDVLAKFDFDNIIKRMVECNSLYLVIKEYPAVYPGERLAGRHYPALHRPVYEHGHQHLYLGAVQGQARLPHWEGAVDRCIPLLRSP